MTPTILLAGATAAFYGCSDFLGGLAARRGSEVTVTLIAHLLGLALLAVALLIFPAVSVHSADLLWGAAAGVSSAVGVTSLYGALARGRMSVVAPITAALSGSLPALFDFARGTRVGPVALVGLGIALVAIVIVSSVGHPEDRAAMPPAAITLSLLAGVSFAGSFILFSLTANASGLAPLVAARVVSVTLMGAAALAVGRGRVQVARPMIAPALGAGALDAAATACMVASIRIGPLAVAAVLGSLYPVATILLARAVLKERLHPAQRFGVALALVAVVMTALR